MTVADTHVWFWALEEKPQLGKYATRVIDSATQSGGLVMPAITPWEIAFAVRKGRMVLQRETRSWIDAALSLPGVEFAPLTPAIAIDSVELPGNFHGDPADRFIVATARALGRPLLTADRAILAYGAEGYVSVIDASL